MRVPLSSRLFFTLLCVTGICRIHPLSAQSDRFVDRYAAPGPTPSGTRNASVFFLVRFPVFPGEAHLNRLQLKRSLSPLYHIVQVAPTDTAVQVWRANCHWKASDALLDKLDRLQARDSITIVTNAVPAIPLRVVQQYGQQAALVRLAKSDWPAFICDSMVQMADVQRRPKAETVINTANYTLNRITMLQQRMPALTGATRRLSIKETLFDTTDIDLLQRYLPTTGAPAETGVHATIMATLAAGAGNSGSTGKGVAPGATLASADFNRLMPETPAYFSQHGIHAQNHSYGTGIENYYGLEAAAYDEQVYAADTLVHVFSAGNSGQLAPGAGRYNGLAGFANLTGTFKQSKNVIVAGGTDSVNRVPVLSSGGPAYDGRIKPELVAYGEEGTSGAAALVSGAVLLVQEHYRRTTAQAAPAALVKALLVNGADDIATPGPDYRSGYGALNAWQAVHTITEQRYSGGTVTNGAVYTQNVTVPPGSHRLKVTLCYTDPPAPLNTPAALVNDLDLLITDAAGNRYAPWVLSSAPVADSLLKPARTGRDSLNNTEQVSIALPAAGTYTITVRGQRVTSGSQRFHLAWRVLPAAHFDWQYPAAANVLPAGEPVALQWETSLSGAGALSFSTDKGATWQPLPAAALEQGRVHWATPRRFGEALLKMEQNGQAYISAPFYISPAVQLQTGFDCADSAMVYWNSIPGVTHYQVYALNGPYLSPYTQTADTVLVLKKNGAVPHVLAVSPVAGLEGGRSRALDFSQQGLDCYVRSFTADLDANGHVQLQLELGSTWQLTRITWERQQAALSQAPLTGGTRYTATDEAPPEGVVYYRAKLETASGRVLYSNAAPVRVLTKNAYLLFPNPAGSTLHLLAKTLQAEEIRILDVQGRLVRRTQLQNLLQPVSLEGLPAGSYWCVVYRNGEKVFTGQFVKL